MSRIFISYRREDTGMGVGRLADSLREHFAREQVFQDISSIDPGADFIEALHKALADCAAVLVVIGPKWLSVADKHGQRRLDNPNDWVRQEIAEALARPGLKVFPLLVDGAEMPTPDDLPEPLKPLARRQAYELTLRHWAKDVAVLVDTLERIPALVAKAATRATPETRTAEPGEAEPPRSLPWKPLAAGIAVLAAAVIVFVVSSDNKPPGSRPAIEPAAVPPPASDQGASTPAATAPARLPQAGETFRDCEQCPEMVVVPAGTFTMGSPPDEMGRDDNEGPQHPVNFARPFAVGKYEVTFEDWDACVEAKACSHRPNIVESVFDWGRGKRAVVDVSWKDGSGYAGWLSRKTGKSYRLLSEAEWEYAARAGTTTRYPWGNELGRNRANIPYYKKKEMEIGDPLSPVGGFGANGFWLHDMIGNVWEWTQDCWHDNYKGAPGDGSAWESGDCGRRVVRGGSWGDDPESARAANRSRDEPDNRNNNLGFRLARTL